MKNILLLHGALGSQYQFSTLEERLSKEYIVHKFNFSGHGGRQIPDAPFSIKLFAQDALEYLESAGVAKADLFGYSMGGYVGLYLARHSPSRIGKVFTLGTKFLWTVESAEHEVKFLDLVKMKQKVPQFYKELQKRHFPQKLEIIVKKTTDMMLNLGVNNEMNEQDYCQIKNEVLISVGDRDKMVSIAESEEMCRMITNAKLLVMPGTPHSFEQVDSDHIVFEIQHYFGI